MENITGTAGVSGAETLRERGRETDSPRGWGMCQLLEKCGKCKNGVKHP